MNSFAFIGMPGPIEMLILGLVCLAPVAVVVVCLIVFGISKRSGPGPTPSPNLYPCPDCGHQVSHLAESCPKCGRPLGPPQDA
jgi:hypothetical protein